MAQRWLRMLLVVSPFAVASCFSPGGEDETETDVSSSDGTTVGSCDPGFVGCPCFPNGTCNVGLVCNNSAVCEPDGGTSTTAGMTATTNPMTTVQPTSDTTADSTTGNTTALTSDGSSSDGSSSSTGGGLSEHRIFVSSVTFPPNFGDVDGADDDCQALADAVVLGGTWRAVLRDSGTDHSDRLTINGVVRNMAEDIVANDSDEFFAGTAVNAPSIDETGDAPADSLAWVGSAADNCLDWSVNDNTANGRQAFSTDLVEWLFGGNAGPCTLSRSIYCIDQDPS